MISVPQNISSRAGSSLRLKHYIIVAKNEVKPEGLHIPEKVSLCDSTRLIA